MARKKQAAESKAPVLFDVEYEDGSLSSNRKVPASEFNPFDDEEDVARAYLEAQDRDIAEKSGRPRGRIKSIAKTKKKKEAKK
jgi:hypothetical protein